MKAAVGFYWTLPVPWAGIVDLGKSINEAAERSRTIRYQRALVQDFARRIGLTLVHEEAFLEIEPDRGSETITEALNKAAAICQREAATLLSVDFSGVEGWRKHNAMLHWLEAARIKSEVIEAIPITLDGTLFDPHAHFSTWRQEQQAWQDGKEERVARALAHAGQLRDAGTSYAAIAEALNSQGFNSATGKAWTNESVRKLIKSS